VKGLSREAYARDALIVAGDLSDDLHTVELTLLELQSRFKEVFYVPGNHELWSETKAARNSTPPASHSLAKLDAVLELCRALGVHTQPRRVGGDPGCRAVYVIPLLSWHEEAFDSEPDLPLLDVPRAKHVMKDYVACKWPPGVGVDDVARVLDGRNEAEWVRAGVDVRADVAAARRAGERVVTFSHFLPRLELCPEKRFLFFPNLVKAVGSTHLGTRVSALRPDIHVFGHTHFSWDAQLADGVRYVSAQLGYPQEQETRMGTLSLGGADICKAPVLLYDSAGCGAFAAKYACRWSDYYASHERQPLSTDIPHWVATRYKARGGLSTPLAPRAI